MYDLIIWIYTHTGNFDTVIFALPVIVLSTLIYWLVRLMRHKHKFGSEYKTIRRKARFNEIIRLLTFCWFCALLCIVLVPTEFWMYFWINIISAQNPIEGLFSGRLGEIYLMPAILKYLIEGHLDWFWLSAGAILPQLLLNVLLFIPLGVSMPFVYKKAALLNTVLTGFALSLSIEFIQFFLGRSCETDDIICNTLGAFVGYILYLLIEKMFPRFTEKGKLSVYCISANENK